MANDSDLLFPEEPDPQKAATNDALQPHPDDWTSYDDAQKLAAPRGAVFETRLAASAVLRELGNERYRNNNFEGARVAYDRSLWQAHFDEAWVKQVIEQHSNDEEVSGVTLTVIEGRILHRIGRGLNGILRFRMNIF